MRKERNIQNIGLLKNTFGTAGNYINKVTSQIEGWKGKTHSEYRFNTSGTAGNNINKARKYWSTSYHHLTPSSFSWSGVPKPFLGTNATKYFFFHKSIPISNFVCKSGKNVCYDWLIAGNISWVFKDFCQPWETERQC